jgi:uncharacterized protein YecE (DUF72 family)
MAGTIRVGTASWTDHDPFYPPEYNKASLKSQRISYYSRFFSLVEVDSTFYHLQPARNFEMWAQRTPEDFIFDVKAYGELTWHHRDDAGEMITPAADTFAAFSQMVQPMRDAGKLGALLFQFPPWYTFDADRLDYFSTIREMLPSDTIAVEFRHRSWLEAEHADETRAALSDARLAYCAVDEPQIGSGSVPPVVMLTDPRFSMVRFHGRNTRMWYGKHLQSSRDRFDYLYTPAELKPWSDRIQRTAEQLSSGQVHVIANNNARTKAYVSPDEFAAGHDHMADVPPALWPSVPQSEGLLTALMLQSLLGQPIGQGEPLPDAVDQTFLTAALNLPSDSPAVS